MKMMPCPLNGSRNISEFTYGGELEIVDNPKKKSDLDWARHIFYHNNDIAVMKEWWCHTATSYWFIAERHTQTDEILETYDSNTIFKNTINFD